MSTVTDLIKKYSHLSMKNDADGRMFHRLNYAVHILDKAKPTSNELNKLLSIFSEKARTIKDYRFFVECSLLSHHIAWLGASPQDGLLEPANLASTDTMDRDGLFRSTNANLTDSDSAAFFLPSHVKFVANSGISGFRRNLFETTPKEAFFPRLRNELAVEWPHLETMIHSKTLDSRVLLRDLFVQFLHKQLLQNALTHAYADSTFNTNFTKFYLDHYGSEGVDFLFGSVAYLDIQTLDPVKLPKSQFNTELSSFYPGLEFLHGDYYEELRRRKSRLLTFTYGDTGPGIERHIRHFSPLKDELPQSFDAKYVIDNRFAGRDKSGAGEGLSDIRDLAKDAQATLIVETKDSIYLSDAARKIDRSSASSRCQRDITLSMLEQRLDDAELSKLATVKSRDAYQRARARLRTGEAKTSTVFVYRLPVMIDWSRFPISLGTFKEHLARSLEVNTMSTQYVLWSENYEHRLELLGAEEGEDQEGHVRTLELVQESEMAGFLDKDDILFEHSGAALFELPSDHHSDYFIRVGNLQSNQSFFSAVFFWTLPSLEETKHIFCDTWSISTAAAVVAEYLMQYAGSLNNPITERVTWSFSPSYVPVSNLSSSLIRDAVRMATEKSGKALFLSSFYSSGGLETAISKEIKAAGEEDEAVLVAIFSIGREVFPSTERILCDIEPLLTERGLKGKAVEVKPNIEVLKVSKVSFFPDYRSVAQEPFLVSDTKANEDFFDRYVTLGVFSTHRNGRNSRHAFDSLYRHHAFHVDLSELFGTVPFVQRTMEQLSGLKSFDCVLHDKSAGALALLRCLQSNTAILPDSSEIFEIDDWRALKSNLDAVEAINTGNNRTLILVPTVITGQTLGDVKRHLRETSIHSLARMHFLIGLLRPSDQGTMKNYTELGSKYVGPASLSVLERVHLPNWGPRECPWCIEQSKIEETLSDSSLDVATKKLLIGRLDQLQNGTSDGLRGTEVFFSRTMDERLPFYAGSVFADAMTSSPDSLDDLSEIGGLESSKRLQTLAADSKVSEADLCLVVANAIQNWRIRNVGKSIKRLTIDAATVSNDDKFNEARLRAAIWRSLRLEELALSVRVSDDFTNMCQRVFSPNEDEHHRCLELEALLGFGPDVIRVFGGDVASWEWAPVKWLARR